MLKVVCKENMCTGCSACVDLCPKNAIEIKDDMKMLNAVIDKDKCVNCGACYNVCPNNNLVDLKPQISWSQGWALDDAERKKSSSGGFAATLSKAFIKNGGVVCSCTFAEGDFRFSVAKNTEELDMFRGSKYVKSNSNGIYRKIKSLLLENKKVLFIGLPCQVAGLQNFINDKLKENLYTVDLICHGTPSVKLLDQYLFEHDIKLSEVVKIEFRNKNCYMLNVDGRAIIHPRIQDRYILTFLKSLTHTENCYSCRYATDKRVGDITIGDSWGSDLIDEVEKGISLVMCQTEKGKHLLNVIPFHYDSVDSEIALKFNHQLRHPAIKSEKREQFFSLFKKQYKFDTIVARIYPKICLKQGIKRVLFKMLGK